METLVIRKDVSALSRTMGSQKKSDITKDRSCFFVLPEKGVDYYDNAGDVTPHKGLVKSHSLSQRSQLTRDAKKLLLCMVGMPARGKSYISAKLFSFLAWYGFHTRVFNVGQHRRYRSGGKSKAISTRTSNSEASFFDSTNAVAKAQREALAMEVLDALLEWFDEEDGEIAIFDATNSTTARRTTIAERCARYSASTETRCEVSIVFVESLCDDEAVLEANMKTKVASSPDFRGMDPELALIDLKQRIANYELAYETVQDAEDHSYIKMYNFSSKVTANQCYGRMSKLVVPFLMAIHSDDRPIYLTALAPTKHEPEYREEAGRQDFETRLAHWWWNRDHSDCRLSVYSSTMPLAIDAGLVVQSRGPDQICLNHTSALNPLLIGEQGRIDFYDRGDFGESYADLVRRLESVLLDIEASVDPVLVITHATPARALRAYFKNINVEKCMGSSTSPESKALADAVPAVLELKPKVGGGWAETVHVI